MLPGKNPALIDEKGACSRPARRFLQGFQRDSDQIMAPIASNFEDTLDGKATKNRSKSVDGRAPFHWISKLELISKSAFPGLQFLGQGFSLMSSCRAHHSITATASSFTLLAMASEQYRPDPRTYLVPGGAAHDDLSDRPLGLIPSLADYDR
jgi:hypothetical protein